MKQLISKIVTKLVIGFSILITLTSATGEEKDLVNEFIKYENIVSEMVPKNSDKSVDLGQVIEAHKDYTEVLSKSPDSNLKYYYVKHSIVGSLEMSPDVDWEVTFEDFVNNISKYTRDKSIEPKIETYLKFKTQLSVVFAKEFKKRYGTTFSPKIESSLAKIKGITERKTGSEVLANFLGTWDQKSTIKLPNQSVFSEDRVSVRKWSKGKKTILFSEDGFQELHFPLTYDSSNNSYRGVFLSGTDTGTVNGTWDSKSNTMHFTIKFTNGSSYKGTHKFIREGYAEAEGKITDKNGELQAEISWKQTRR